MVDLYDESRDTFFTVSWKDLLQHAALDDADKVRFADIGRTTFIEDVSAFTAVVAGRTMDIPPLPPVDQNIPAVTGDYITIIRKTVMNGIGAPGAFTPRGVAAAVPRPDAGDVGPGLILITNKRRFDAGVGIASELRTFYTGSGWFNGSGDGENQYTFRRTFAAPAIGIPNNLDEKKALFKMLGLGFKNGAAILNPMIRYGFRPNLHIGRMVYASMAPETMRFKHVAGHILAQTVVTRPLAIRLMQRVQGDAEHAADGLNDSIRYVYGVHRGLFNLPVARMFDASNTALAYMTAATFHPDPEVRNRCSKALKDNLDWDISKIGNDLVTWLKLFLNTIPAADGAETPLFNALVMGRSLEETFKAIDKDDIGPDTDQDGNIDQQKRDRLPVMYLGEFNDPVENNAKFDNVQPPLPFGYALYQDPRVGDVPKWIDRQDDPAMYRDVAGRTFKTVTATVFPIDPKDRDPKKRKVARQDIIAVNQSASAMDAMIAFVQIMSKRFFTHAQELFVETQPQGNIVEPNTKMVGLQYGGGITRRALTSNEYPSLYSGSAESMRGDTDKWELVIVRPNIEHNMLAAVLGRGGSDDLGSTFWGQTELSCYDDSMHGVWGMSYKVSSFNSCID